MGADKQKTDDKSAAALRLSPFLLLLFLITAVLLCLALPQSNAQKSDNFSLTILHTNDLHSHDQSFAERGKTIGGMARLAHLIRQYRAQTPNSLTIDAGDIFQGTPFFTIYKGEVEVEMLNRAGYDLYTIGNHEFDGGGKNLAKQLQAAKFQILSCNLDCKDLPELGALIKPSTIKIVNGEKIGFVGAITPDIENLSLTRDGANLKTGDYHSVNPPYGATGPAHDLAWLAPIKAEVDKLSDAGINKIILVTHCGVEVDKIIAAELPAVDAIIGGHSHTRLDTPIVVEHKDGSHTLIVQTGCYSRNLGKFDLVFDKKGVVDLAETKYKLVHVDVKVPEDKDIKDALMAKEAPVLALRDTIVTTARSDFDNNFRVMKSDSALGDLICDSFINNEEANKEGVEIALENRGGIRSRIDQGQVSLEKVEEILPFENHMIYATISGARLRQAIEHSIDAATGGKFLDVAGLKFAWDPQAPAGHRLVFIQTHKAGQWTELSDDDHFRIAITDYSFSGGEGYEFKDAADVHKTEKKLNTYLRSYLEKHKDIKPQWPTRICPVNAVVVAGINQNQWGDTMLGFDDVKVDIYCAEQKGVTAIAPQTTIPLAVAEPIARGCSIAQAKQLLHNRNNSNSKSSLKAWTALVVKAQGAKGKHLTLVSYPLGRDDLAKF